MNGEPGIREETLHRLANFAKDLKDSTGEHPICSLIFDEIYIRKQTYWDQHLLQYVGYPTYPTTEREKDYQTESGGADDTENDDSNPEDIVENNTSRKANKPKKPKGPRATRALVFFLSGVNRCFQFPVAYHFVRKLNAKDLAELVKEVIIKISECGVKISNMTFDGAKENIAMCKILGANLDISSENFKPFIVSPFDSSQIYLWLDPPHMIKLMRNLLGNNKILIDGNDNEIKWCYFEELLNVGKGGRMLTHKLTKKHIEMFKGNKMNVRMAVETFSSSVADSMEILRRSGHPKFVGSEPTIRFIRMMDKLFDIFNSKDTHEKNIYKRPLNFVSKREIFEFLEECTVYLKSLKIDRVRSRKGIRIRERRVDISSTPSYTPILGFLMDIFNLKQMYAEYVESNDEENENDQYITTMKFLRTYPLNQDHLEIFFGKIRARNGFNNNPNVSQFKGAYRRLLTNLEIRPPRHSNCLIFESHDGFASHVFKPQSNIYNISSFKQRIDIVSSEDFQRNLKEFEDSQGNIETLEAVSDLQSMLSSNHLLDGISEISVAYAAKLIENKLSTREIYCNCCKSVFEENEKLRDRAICLIPSKIPCVSTYYICKIANKYISMFRPTDKSNANEANPIDFRVLLYSIYKEIDYNNLFTSTNFGNHVHHKLYLIKFIVQQFIFMKTAQISKEITYEDYGDIIRHKYTKWILSEGQ